MKIDYNLGAQIKWWSQGMRDITKSGSFNWKHYCKVIEAKYENLYGTLLDEGVCGKPSEKNTDNDNGIR